MTIKLNLTRKDYDYPEGLYDIQQYKDKGIYGLLPEDIEDLMYQIAKERGFTVIKFTDTEVKFKVPEDCDIGMGGNMVWGSIPVEATFGANNKMNPCSLPGCFYDKVDGSKYCHQHANGVPTQFEKAGNFSYRHICHIEGCGNPKADANGDSNLCEDHLQQKVDRSILNEHNRLFTSIWPTVLGRIKILEDAMQGSDKVFIDILDRLDKLEGKDKPKKHIDTGGYPFGH